MSNTAIIELIHNTALLLALVLLFDMVFRNHTWEKTILNQILIGIVIGFIGLLIMVSPMTFIPGVVFDTRSILLGIAGLFFGTIPTLAAMLITAAYRAYQGGAGALMGVLVIFSTGTIGILWRQKRKGLIAAIRPLELYFFGVVIHIVMMLLALTLPPDTARRILANLTLPVIVIYPVGTMLLGLLFIMRMRREIQAENVAESETRYKIVAENPYDWEYWMGTEGNYIYCSPSCLSITGFSREEITGDPQITWNLIHPEDKAAYKKHRETSAEEKKGQNLDMRIIRKDGGVRWISHICRPVYGEDGEYLGTRGSNRDITQEKIAQFRLEDNEEKYRSLTEQISDVLWIMDTSTGYFTYVSPSVEKLRGFTVEEVMSQPVIDALSPDYREEFARNTADIVTGVLKGKISPDSEFTRDVMQPCKDGSFVITEVKTNFYLNKDTGHVEVRGVSRDITERNKAEKALRDSEEKYRLVVENQRDMIAKTDEKGKFSYANPAFCQFFDKTEEELIGNIFNPEVHPEDQDRVIKAFRNLGTPPHEFRTEQRVKSNGKWIYTTWTMRAIVNDGGQISSIITSGRDISERKLAELEIETAQVELKKLLVEADESRQVLLSMLEDQKLAEEALQQEQYLMTSLMETIPDTIYFKDLNGRFLRVNKAQAQLLGVDAAQDVLGRTDFEFFARRHADLAFQQEQEIIKTGMGVINQEELLYFENKPAQWVSTTKMPLHNSSNEIIGTYGVTRDISNIKKAEEELQTAYDATLQGWAAALELREKETAAHSRNVVDMTLKLAREFDIPDRDMVHVRRGALLHDIGKMGIPDDILLKPGKLTDEEWVIMKMHPIFAFELLSDIPYLQPALDIPYAHHERWDGSGYPLGLKETNIPLVARIFAVVDVWDALSSDRPYRPAWNKKAVHDYLREKSGSQFDPQVVEAFLNILSYEVDVPERGQQ